MNSYGHTILPQRHLLLERFELLRGVRQLLASHALLSPLLHAVELFIDIHLARFTSSMLVGVTV